MQPFEGRQSPASLPARHQPPAFLACPTPPNSLHPPTSPMSNHTAGVPAGSLISGRPWSLLPPPSHLFSGSLAVGSACSGHFMGAHPEAVPSATPGLPPSVWGRGCLGYNAETWLVVCRHSSPVPLFWPSQGQGSPVHRLPWPLPALLACLSRTARTS